MNYIEQKKYYSGAMKKESETQQRFSELVAAHSGIVFKIAHTYCWHPDDRNELQQEIVTQLWKSFPKFDVKRSFSTWMYRVAFNVSISYVRSNSRHKEHVIAYDDRIHDIEDSSAQENDDPRLEFLQKFIGGLDPLNRALMVLYLEERSYCEIAEIIGISESNVASKISRLKKRVRQESSETNSQENQHGTQ